MNLDAYRQKRDFVQTPEPDANENASVEGWRFVIQKHAATNLHYDLRLEYQGVLKSWAIPKGPSLDPGDKRLAIQTEDHPVRYLEFEGVIPQGQYGAGAMLVWDAGTWEPLQDDGLETGDLKFELHGEKLSGKWMLVHTGKRKSSDAARHWLLFKERDNKARPSREFDVTEELPDSVLTGRSLEQIELDSRTQKASEAQQPNADLAKIDASSVNKAKRTSQPTTVACCLPTAARVAPSGKDWIHEIKYDGYRMMCFVDESVRFVSRNGNDWTDRLPHLKDHIQQLGLGRAIIDGEVVVIAEDGRTNFQLLQTTISTTENYRLKYYAFDLLYLDGHDLRACELLDRKHILRCCIPEGHATILFSEHIEGDGPTIFQQACRLGTEGIVSKRATRRYIEGRTEEWLKTKCLKTDEFVVGGYTDSKSQRRGLGALVVGRFAGDKLVYQGRVGTGFNAAMLKSLFARLSAIETQSSPFSNLTRHDVGRDCHWVEPTMVVEVEYGGWTNEGKLRFPAFRGVRDEIDPQTVVLDKTTNPPGMQPVSKTQENEEPVDLIPTSLPDVKFTNPDRLMYPDDGVSKIGLAAYIAQVSSFMLPHVVDRPLALVRCPKGYGEQCFFQKKPTKGMPDCIEEMEVSMKGANAQPAVVIRDLEGLLTLVQFSALEIHTWGCRSDRPDRPDAIVFDLDPDNALPFSRVADVALQIRENLLNVGLESFVKTSGGKGLHILSPIRRRATWENVSAFSEAISGKLAGKYPGSFTTSPSKSQRKGKIYIDTLRNRFGATAIAAYSTRARGGAPVSMPISWDELPTITSAAMFTTQNAPPRLMRLGKDPWGEFKNTVQSLTKSMLRQVK